MSQPSQLPGPRPEAPLFEAMGTGQPPVVSINTSVPFSDGRTATLSGTVSDANGIVTDVTVSDGNRVLGHATLNANGTWTLPDARFGPGFHDLTATATDSLGNVSAPTSAPFSLETGIRGLPYSSAEEDLDSQGNLVAEVYSRRDGAVYLADYLTHRPNGDTQIDYYTGTYFDNQNYFFTEELFGADGSQKLDTRFNNDGSHTITSFLDNQILASRANDTMTGGGSGERFVFSPHFGQDLVTDFIADGSGHDILSLSSHDFANVHQLFAHTETVDGNAVIHVTPTDTITLQNVTEDQLKTHPRDIRFHA